MTPVVANAWLCFSRGRRYASGGAMGAVRRQIMRSGEAMEGEPGTRPAFCRWSADSASNGRAVLDQCSAPRDASVGWGVTPNIVKGGTLGHPR
jgi:hypothetical protein